MRLLDLPHLPVPGGIDVGGGVQTWAVSAVALVGERACVHRLVELSPRFAHRRRALVEGGDREPACRQDLGRAGEEGRIVDRLAHAVALPERSLLFSEFAVIIVLATSYLTYTVIPIYAAMKAIDSNLFEAALDLGAGWWTSARRVLLPLIAPGIFIALLLVYIPLFTDFASPALVGGTSGYMLGNAVQDLVLESGI